MRFLNASISAKGAREMATRRTSRAARCGSVPSKWSPRYEQLGQPSFHPVPSMKWYTISWLLPSNRSASVCLPLGPSNTYFLSIFSQGSSRRCLLISSHSRVSSFSFFNNSTLADRHFSALTTSCCIAVFVISSSPTVNLVGHGIAVPFFRGALLRPQLTLNPQASWLPPASCRPWPLRSVAQESCAFLHSRLGHASLSRLRT